MGSYNKIKLTFMFASVPNFFQELLMIHPSRSGDKIKIKRFAGVFGCKAINPRIRQNRPPRKETIIRCLDKKQINYSGVLLIDNNSTEPWKLLTCK